MSDKREVRNQTELNQAIKDGAIPVIASDATFDISKAEVVECSGSSQPRVVCSGSSQPRVVCYDSSQPRVECYDSSQPRVECYDSSQPRVVCSGSSQPRVECYDSSQPRVVCSGSSQPRVECYDSSQPRVVCSGYAQLAVDQAGAAAPEVTTVATNSVFLNGNANISGDAKVARFPGTNSPEEWCSLYGVPVVDGVATVFKAVNDEFKSGYNFPYTPGTTPEAPDWDGGYAECGGGLHFSPRPVMALAFNSGATKFVACQVRLADMRSPKKGDSYPQKIKAKGCCSPVAECDIDGEPMTVNAAVVATA